MCYTIVLLFVVHYVADFLLQSREMGTKKSTEIKWLLKHLGIMFGAFAIVLFPIYGTSGIIFAALNTAIHGVIDWNIWKLYKFQANIKIKRQAYRAAVGEPDWNVPFETRYNAHYAILAKNFKYWEDHLFYATIGLDQLLHAVTIILLLRFLV